MSEKKPIPIMVDTARRDCPVCGKRSYSRSGVHPQCAMLQSDRLRKIRFGGKKPAKAIAGKRPGEKSWTGLLQKKTCP